MTQIEQNIEAAAVATAHPPQSALKNIIGMDEKELAADMAALGFESYRTKQLWNWVYTRGHKNFERMSTFSKAAQEKLSQYFYIDRLTITENQISVDGTRKWLFKMQDGQQVEAVFIPDVVADRGALCISSQVGCTLTCRFCHTGTQRLVRNLTAAEIVGQVLKARDEVGDWQAKSQDQKINNLVFMGMGEPLFNYEEVAKAIHLLKDPDGISISKRRITVSTSGVVPLINRCGAELGVNLAVSLHAANDDVRSAIMPINKKYPIKELLDACRTYPGATNARRITFEYVMLKGVNDSDADARALVKILRDIPSKINLIPFNAWPGSPFECSDPARIERFGDILNANGYASPIRKTRGADIMAACGQLKSASLRLTKNERDAIAQLQHEKDVAQGLA